MRNIILAMAGLAVSGVAAAEGPSWTYADVGYLQGSTVGDGDTDALVLTGSFGFADKYHVGASYFDGSIAAQSIGNGIGSFDDDADFDGYEIWAGINPAVTDNTDFVFQVLYADFSIDNDFGGSDFDSDYYGTRIGLRSMYTDQVEIFGNVQWVDGDIDDIGDSNDLTRLSVNVGGQYFFTDAISVNITANVSDDTTAQFGARWSF